MADRSGEFFVGYAPTMPARHARIARASVIVLALAIPAILAVAAAMQAPVDPGAFEFGTVRTFEGTLQLEPVPMLHGSDPDTGDPAAFALCGPWKFAVPPQARAFDGQRVRFDGTLIHRGSHRMIEMNSPESIRAVEGDLPPAVPATVSLGAMALRGEIVDTKCFLGVMRPAIGKVHRGCAIRCLSGGIPPGLRVVDKEGRETVLLLAGRPGEPLELDVQLAGVPVEVDGEVEVQGDFAILHVRSIRRL